MVRSGGAGWGGMIGRSRWHGEGGGRVGYVVMISGCETSGR